MPAQAHKQMSKDRPLTFILMHMSEVLVCNYVFICIIKAKRSRGRVKQRSVHPGVIFGPSSLFISTCIVPRLSFAFMKHRVSTHEKRRPVHASDTEIMFKNDSPVPVTVECDRKQ